MSDIRLKFIPVKMRLPLKFGSQVIDSIQICHVEFQAYGCWGIGETPLSVGWAWPSALPFDERESAMLEFCRLLAQRYPTPECHPLTAGKEFLDNHLDRLLEEFNATREHPMPYLAALISASAFDIALHDAFGKHLGIPTFHTFNAKYLEHDLSWFYDDSTFAGKYPQDFFVTPQETLPVWHLVGGKDLLLEAERTGEEPQDDFPVSLEKWIERDGLKCLKIKLTGLDAEWDYNRLVTVGRIAESHACDALSPDFNCMVKDPEYVNAILDKLSQEEPAIFQKLLYVEQPFPYDLKSNRIDVHSTASRKPLFMDESAHNWRMVKLGHELGWNGVALKVCKTLTGAILAGCWAKAHDMKLMVQDLTNPMLAMLPHAQLATYIGTICGLECNAPQFYPLESIPYENQYPGLYERRNGQIRLPMLNAPGLG